MYRLTGLGLALALLLAAMEGTASLGYLDDFIFSGDLDGDGQDELIQLFRSDPGGSGTFVYINLIVSDPDGEPRSLVQLVGDRVQVVDARVEEGLIRLEVIQPGDDHPLCCGSRKLLRRWKLEGGGLVELPPEEKGVVTLEDLEGRTWRLVQLGDSVLEANPEITLEFAKGQVRGLSGCNQYFAEVQDAQKGGAGGLSVGPVGSTRKACPPPIMELEQRYLEALRQLVRFDLAGSDLILYWKRGDAEEALRFTEILPDEQNRQ